MYISIIILASMLLWGAVIHELSKPSKKQSTRKIVFFDIFRFFIDFSYYYFTFSKLPFLKFVFN